MSGAGPQNPAPRAGLARILAVAVVTGLAAGALFAVRDVAFSCRMYRNWRVNYDAGLSVVLAPAATATAWYAAAGCALAVLVGIAAWVAARVHGYRLDTARAAAVCAGAFVFAALPSMLTALVAADVAFVTVFCSVGFGCAAYAAGRWSGATARLAAAAAGLAAACWVASCWTLWLAKVRPVRVAGLKGGVTLGVLLLLAIALGVGVYRLVLAVLRRDGPRDLRRAAQGGALVLASVGLLAIGSWAIQPAQPRWTRSAEPNTRPNIVWLVMDTARADALSCYGDLLGDGGRGTRGEGKAEEGELSGRPSPSPRRQTTPCLDRLAADAALFERAYAQSSWTLPSHASMFTGLLLSGHGVTDEHLLLHDDSTTIAEVLAQNGYATLACSANLFISPKYNTSQGFERFYLVPWGRGPEYSLLLSQVQRGLHLTDDGSAALNRVAARWVAEAHDADRPFFLFINYIEPHRDYGSTPYLGRWLPPGVSLSRALRVPQSLDDYAAGVVPPGRRDFGILRALYEGDVTYLDERIGELVEDFRRLGILDNTLLIVTSDHGEELGEHGVVGHNARLRDTLLHVPLILRYPQRFPPGTRRFDVVELVDLFPTILDVAGVAWDGRAQLHGRSLLSPRPEAEQFAIAQRDIFTTWLADMVRSYRGWNAGPLMRRFMSIQDRRYKYVWASDDTAELFDLTQDPFENHNVIGGFPPEAARLRAALEARVGRLRPGVSAAALAQAARETSRRTP